jgi:hypothetical protein
MIRLPGNAVKEEQMRNSSPCPKIQAANTARSGLLGSSANRDELAKSGLKPSNNVRIRIKGNSSNSNNPGRYFLRSGLVVRTVGTEVFPILKDVLVSSGVARYFHIGTVVGVVRSPTALGPGSLSLPPHDTRHQVGQVHSSSTTNTFFGNSFRDRPVHNVVLRGACFTH